MTEAVSYNKWWMQLCNNFICHPHLQVNTNGVLSFDQPFQVRFPGKFPNNSIGKISPYWQDFDTSQSGRIYYRNTTDITLLRRAQFSLWDTFPSARDFFPSYLFIATWDGIPELGLTGDSSLVNCIWLVQWHNHTRFSKTYWPQLNYSCQKNECVMHICRC